MTQVASNAHRVEIVAPASTTLAQAAQAMSVGTWAQLTLPTNATSLFIRGGSEGNMIPYCNKAPWNAVTNRVEYLTMDHGFVSLQHLQFDEATHSIIDNGNAPMGPAHHYDHTAVDPNGVLWHRRYRQGFNPSGWEIDKRSVAGVWSAGQPYVSNTNVAMGTCWWSGSLSGVANSYGAFVWYESVLNGTIFIYDPSVSGAAGWTTIANAKRSGWTMSDEYHCVMQYSPIRNCAVFGGGDANTTRVARLNSDRSISTLPDVPSGMSIGIQQGNLNVDPISGDFILVSRGQIASLNPTGSGTWTVLAGSRIPPARVSNPGSPDFDSLISTTLPEHGVILYVSAKGAGGLTFDLYKHA